MSKSLSIFGALMFGLCFSANAQIDSTHYNLGRVSVKKDFTQSITIKGSDLERYLFSDLADAINVWLYGTYSNSSTLVYVIDGNIINDVNAYSIYDIESVTLVQNALSQASGASPGEQMVLIKLKTGGSGKQGVEGAGQTSVVDLRNTNTVPGKKATTNFYNQYYISGYKNLKNANFGMSADYQYDVSPALISDKVGFVNPFHFARVKLNAYANVNLWKGSKLTARFNYIPQESSMDSNYAAPLSTRTPDAAYSNIHTTQHFVNTNISLDSHILKGLTNTFSATYSRYNYFEKDSIYTHSYTGSPGGFTQLSLSTAYNRSSTLLIRNNLFYQIRIGGFTFEPSVNFSYRNVSTYGGYGIDSVLIFSPVPNSSDPYGSSGGDMWSGPTKTYLITPSLNMYYKDVINIQGGIVNDITPDEQFGDQKLKLPLFLSTMIDVGKISGYTGCHFQLFGSYSRENPISNESYSTITGFPAGYNTTWGSFKTPTGAGYLQQGNAYYTYTPLLSTVFLQSDNYHAGTVAGLLKDVTLNYDFEYLYNRDPLNPGNVTFTFIGYKLTTNRLGLNYNNNSEAFNWRAGLNITQSELQLIKETIHFPVNFNTDIFNKGHRYSGGFTNRFACKNLFAGMDILYQIGERPYQFTNIAQLYTTDITQLYPNYHVPSNYNSFSLQNLYFGSKIRLPHLKYAEAFINGHNILQNKNSDITDNRRFFGVGFKATL